MSPATAIRTFFNNGPTCNPAMQYHPVTVKEIKDFKDVCTPEEYLELAGQAAKLLGETLDKK